jgi:DNA polymerase-1
MPTAKPTLYLIDGNSYIYRAYYAIRNLSTSKGFPTNAIYGFTTMLMKVAGEKKPDYLAVAFDPKGPTTRHEVFKEYKATRPPMPDTLIPQIPYIHKVVEAFNIPVLLMPGIEADDVIAAVTRKAAREGYDVTIVTGDKDLYQLIGENVRIYDTMKDELFGPLECEKKFGVPPSAIPELLGLTGDSSDNIPGVRGVGPKTALQLISEFGTIEDILANIDKISKPKLRESLREHAEDARLSRRLVELMHELPVELNIEALKRRPQDSRALIELFKEFEFTALLKYVSPEERPSASYMAVTTEKELALVIKEIIAAGECAVDTETTSVLPMSGEPVGISLCSRPDVSYYIPFGHVTAEAPTPAPPPSVGEGDREGGERGVPVQRDLFPGLVKGQLPKARVIETLRPVLEDAKIKKYGHNIKYDMIVLKNAGLEIAGVSFDTMVGSYLLNPGRAGHNLENVSLEHLSHKKMTFADAAGSGSKQVSFSLVDIETATRYSAEDAYVTFRLASLLKSKLVDAGLLKLFDEIELPLISVLAEIEMAGVNIDTGFLGKMSDEIDRALEDIVRKVYALAGEEFNINSPKQLSYILFEKLGLVPTKRTKTGMSTDEGVLLGLAVAHELPAEILNYRELYKLKSTYVDALARLVNPRTGRVHTSLNQAVTATGRLSSSDPNLQNIPIRGEWGRRIRQAFVAPGGSVIISADYSQVELRIMAHLANDASLIESFKKDEDVHGRTASEIFGVAPDMVTPEMRRKAKAVNFGIMYGMGAFGLSTQIGVHPKEAQNYINAYFERHAGVKVFIEKNLREVEEKGYSTTIFGRKRMIPELKSDNRVIRAQGERLAINTPIQGSAADLIKVAMINISRRLKREGLLSMMVLQVHDELVFESPMDEANAVEALVKEEMEGAVSLSVPVKVDVGSGPNWGEAH